MTNPADVFATVLLSSLPVLVIAVVGIVLCHRKLPQSHAKARRLATGGLSLMALETLVRSVMSAYVTVSRTEGRVGLPMVNALSIVNAVAYLLLLVSLVLMLLAVLADRETRPSPPVS